MPETDPPLNSAKRQTWVAQVEHFFFAEEQPYALALVRILLPWTLLVAAIPRWFHVRELYSTDGAVSPFWDPYGYQLPQFILSPALAMAAFTAMIFSLVTVSIGWRTRTSLIVVLVLYPYFGLVDTLSTLTKYTTLATHLMFLLAMSGCGKVWSLDAWLSREQSVPSTCSVWPRRLIQLLIGIVYLGAVATKVKMPEFLSGDLMRFWMLTNTNFPNPVGEAMALHPALIVVMCYITLLWEATFIFLCWKGPTRNIVLGLGLFFHAMTYLMLGLIVFPLIYSVLYICFLEAHEARRLGDWAQNLWHKTMRLVRTPAAKNEVTVAASVSGWTSLITFGCALLVVASLAVTAEARWDVYGTRRATGPFTLQPITPEREAELFPAQLNIHPIDKVFAFDAGSMLLGGQLADPRTTFRHGERLLVQCTLTPPHEDLWLEINLHDPNDLQIQRFGMVAPRESTRVNASFPISDSLAPGTYALILRLQNREVVRRHIEIQSR